MKVGEVITRIKHGQFEAFYWVGNSEGEVLVRVNGGGTNCTMCQPSHSCTHANEVRSRLLKQSGVRHRRHRKQKAAQNANLS